MKMVIAIIRTEYLENVKMSLFNANITKMTVFPVKGCGQQKGYTENYRGNILNVNLLPKVRLEIALNDNFVDPTIKAIYDGARTGNIGDGKIFVLPIEKCYRIRTGEEGNDAIG